MKALFYLGELIETQGVAFDQNKSKALRPFINKCIERHVSGDWGDLTETDKYLNNLALKPGDNQGRLVSKYKLPEDLKEVAGEEFIYIITEWDHSVTTVMYPSEY